MNLGVYISGIISFVGSLVLFSLAFGSIELPDSSFLMGWLIKYKILFKVISICCVVLSGYKLMILL